MGSVVFCSKLLPEHKKEKGVLSSSLDHRTPVKFNIVSRITQNTHIHTPQMSPAAWVLSPIWSYSCLSDFRYPFPPLHHNSQAVTFPHLYKQISGLSQGKGPCVLWYWCISSPFNMCKVVTLFLLDSFLLLFFSMCYRKRFWVWYPKSISPISLWFIIGSF